MKYDINELLLDEPTREGWIVPTDQRIPQERDHTIGPPAVPEAPPRIVLHCTESMGYRPEATRRAFARHPYPPHLWISLPGLNSHTYTPDSNGSRTRTEHWNSTNPAKPHLTILQRRPLEQVAWALRHKPSETPHTNHMGICAQIEIEGYAGDAANWSATTLHQIAAVCARITRWIRQHNSDQNWMPTPYIERGQVAGSYGAGKTASKLLPRKERRGGANRMTATEWRTATRSAKRGGGRWGMCGHASVPDNLHWDPGALDMAAIYASTLTQLGYNIGANPDPRKDVTAGVLTPNEARRKIVTPDTTRAAQLAAQIETAAKEIRKALG